VYLQFYVVLADGLRKPALGPLHYLDRHVEVDEARLQQRQREHVFRIDPTVDAAGMIVALVKFQKWTACRPKFRPQVNPAEQKERLGRRIALPIEVFGPVMFTDWLVEVVRSNPVLVANFLDLPRAVVRNALVNEQLAPGRRGRRLHRPVAERQRETEAVITVVLATLIPAQGLGDLRRRCQERLARTANEGPCIADERRRQQAARANEKSAS
jgi:hypothetical protein